MASSDGDEARIVAAERARIARELHDIVAHLISMIVLQADAADSVLDQDPERARVAIRTISELSRRSMDEMRQVVGVLRDDLGGADGDSRQPPPGLMALRDLVSGLVEAGLPVEVDLQGDLESLPRGLDLCAYRIVQESLTNVLKHAGPQPTLVRVARTSRELVLEVSNEGPRGADRGQRGHGLVGMSERVALFGGRFEAGPASAGGWRVAARLPVPTGQPSLIIRRP